MLFIVLFRYTNTIAMSLQALSLWHRCSFIISFRIVATPYITSIILQKYSIRLAMHTFQMIMFHFPGDKFTIKFCTSVLTLFKAIVTNGTVDWYR